MEGPANQVQRPPRDSDFDIVAMQRAHNVPGSLGPSKNNNTSGFRSSASTSCEIPRRWCDVRVRCFKDSAQGTSCYDVRRGIVLGDAMGDVSSIVATWWKLSTSVVVLVSDSDMRLQLQTPASTSEH